MNEPHYLITLEGIHFLQVVIKKMKTWKQMR